MASVSIKKGSGFADEQKRVLYLTQIEQNATTDQLEKLAVLSKSGSARKKLDNSFTLIKSMLGI